MSSLPL